MGTRKTSANPKKTITHVYRGLLDIVHQNHARINQDIISHVRSFDREPNEHELEINVIGFWRMLLELIFNCYTQTTKIMGITLIFALVIISYPLRLFGTLCGGMWFSNHRRVIMSQDEYDYYYGNQPNPDQKENTTKKDPDLGSMGNVTPNDGKVVRRVVYEEAKVSK